MRLRPRLTIFTVLLVVTVVTFTGLLTLLSVQYLLRQEMRSNQTTIFNNFREASSNALYLGDDLGVKVYSESLEKSVSGLAYAIFQDHTRGGILLGGIESLERFKRLKPVCPQGSEVMQTVDLDIDDNRWRLYCQAFGLSDIRGREINGDIFLGFKLDFLESELQWSISRMAKLIIWSMLVVLALGLLMAYFLAGRLTQPIRHLTEGAKSIGAGKLDTQIPIESTDELGFLAQEFNLMAIKLRELDQLKDDFISSVSHELRSPLAAIAGYVELLESKPIEEIPADKREKAMVIIRQSTERLSHFINDILDLAKLKSGHVQIRKKELRINDLCDDVTTLFQPLFEKKNITTEQDMPEDLPLVNADEDKIRQVLTNLISNALKFTPSGGKIRISSRNQNEFVQVSIKDTGAGIPESALESIFERFKQADNQETVGGAQRGTGLGLAIAKGIIESHGGRIWIESELGKGTTVHITLPI